MSASDEDIAECSEGGLTDKIEKEDTLVVDSPAAGNLVEADSLAVGSLVGAADLHLGHTVDPESMTSRE